MSVLVSIGDFSRMTHLSIKALRFYHDQGLLEPARIDPATGYRFYEPGEGAIEWVVAGYAISTAVLLVTGGRLGDRFGAWSPNPAASTGPGWTWPEWS